MLIGKAEAMHLQGRTTMDLTRPATSQDHVLGPLEAKVVLVEYADYECPLSGRAHWILKDVTGWYRNLFCFVYRHYPCAKKHPRSRLAAIAAEAAALQGCFWDMHDHLFAHQQLLDRTHLIRYAAELRLDVDRFVRDLEHGAGDTVIEDHIASGTASGVRSTPAFFVNGERQTSWDLDDLVETISLGLDEDNDLPA
jgi:NhaA family Na+:H+ antiporter